jgi:DNA-directed RNA polymerases I, II, and III subunit RPABC4
MSSSTPTTTKTESCECVPLFPFSRARARADASPPRYVCGDCGVVNRLKAADPVRCQQCGYRILYKARVKKALQYEAR